MDTSPDALLPDNAPHGGRALQQTRINAGVGHRAPWFPGSGRPAQHQAIAAHALHVADMAPAHAGAERLSASVLTLVAAAPLEHTLQPRVHASKVTAYPRGSSGVTEAGKPSIRL